MVIGDDGGDEEEERAVMIIDQEKRAEQPATSTWAETIDVGTRRTDGWKTVRVRCRTSDRTDSVAQGAHAPQEEEEARMRLAPGQRRLRSVRGHG